MFSTPPIKKTTYKYIINCIWYNFENNINYQWIASICLSTIKIKCKVKDENALDRLQLHVNEMSDYI